MVRRRYSVHESEMSHSSGLASRTSANRSSYKGSTVSRYSSIFEESSGRESASPASILSPTSGRRYATASSTSSAGYIHTIPSYCAFYGV